MEVARTPSVRKPPISLLRKIAMEQTIEAATSQPDPMARAPSPERQLSADVKIPVVSIGPLTPHCLIVALAGGAGFFALSTLSLALARIDPVLAAVWMPHAAAVALLLLARPRNELPTYAAFVLASLVAYLGAELSLLAALHLTFASVLEVVLVTWLVRRYCATLPDLTRLVQLGRFLETAGLIGPAIAVAVAAPALGASWETAVPRTISWFLANSIGMVLILPAGLLVAQAWRNRTPVRPHNIVEAGLIMLGGLAAASLVFQQGSNPLLFLVPPITMLVAFRLGSLGTALFVPAVAAIASLCTHWGLGPIAHFSGSQAGQVYVLQAFVAVNFFAALPIAAILAGRERLTGELIEGQNEIALLTENIADAVLRFDGNGICTYASPSVQNVLGRAQDDFIGRSVAERTHVDAHERIVQVLERLQTGVSVMERITYRRLLDSEEGMPVFIEADCAVITDPETGARNGIVVSARDVTDRVELELLLTRARAVAENAARAKTEFLANMSHELRTPMNGVLGFAELMLQDEIDENNRRHADLIVQSGRSMMMLLNDILDLSKIEAGEITIDRGPVDLFATIAECAALHRPAAESKGLQLRFSASSSVESGDDGDPQADEQFQRPWIKTDGLRLRQIILNLVGNAVKFTEVGHVEISYRASPDEIVVEVSDTGIGISANRLKSIFAPFTQGESDTARRFGGTGLGLTISRQLAELLGGTIDVNSTAGLGSSFRLTLPADYVAPLKIETSELDFVEPADLPQSARILLVEDHDVNRILATEMLERCGQHVAIAHDGNEAIAMVIEASMRDRLFDLVLMDIQMPGCDGYAATRAIRAEGIGPEQMPIIALTANAYPDDRARARDSGMQGHLAKPLVFADLARVLQRWLPTRIVDDEDEGTDCPPFTAKEAPSESRASETSMPMQDDRISASPAPAMQTPAPSIPSQAHSPALLARWNERRSEAIEAVRDALARGELGAEVPCEETFDALARLVHKLAGTAAIFGEGELGEKASAFERALRERFAPDLIERIAFDLLSIADDPTDRFEQTGT